MLNKLFSGIDIKKSILFIILLFCYSFYLIRGKGTWIYVDAFFWPYDNMSLHDFINTSIFNVLEIKTKYYGNFGEVSVPFRYIINFFIYVLIKIIGFNYSQFVFLVIYFVSIFFLSYKIFRTIFKDVGGHSSFYTALFMTFNPVYVWFSSQPGIMFSIIGFLLLWYISLIYFSSENRLLNDILIFLGLNLALLYFRLIPIHLINCVLIFIIHHSYYKDVHSRLSHKYILKRFLTTFLIVIFTNVPVIFGLFNVFFGSNNLSNYTERNVNGSWVKNTSESFLDSFILNSVTENFNFFGGVFYEDIGLLLITLILYSCINKFKVGSSLRYFFKSSLLCLLFVQFILIFPFKNIDKLISLYVKIFFFLSGNIRWLEFLLPVVFSGLIYCTLRFTENKKFLKIFKLVLILYLFLPSINFIKKIPMFSKIDNGKLAVLANTSGHSTYVNGSFYYPYKEIVFSEFPYQIYIPNLMIGNSQLFSSNLRVSSKEELYLSKNSNSENIYENYKYLGLKKIFLAKPKVHIVYDIAFYPQRDFYADYLKDRENLIKNPEIEETTENEYFEVFSIKDSDSFDYSIYLPNRLLDQSDFGRVACSKNDRCVFVNDGEEKFLDKQNIQIELKLSKNSPYKSFFHLSGLGQESQVYMQQNKNINNNWVLYPLNRDEYENVKCFDNFFYYHESGNSVCHFDTPSMDLLDIGYIFKKTLNIRPNKGNFIGNLWEIDPRLFDSEELNEGSIYGVIVYKNQIYYMITLCISATVSSILVFLVLIKRIAKSKNNVK